MRIKNLVLIFVLLILSSGLTACSVSTAAPLTPTAAPVVTLTPLPSPIPIATATPTQSPSRWELFMQGLLPYPSNPLGFESSPLDQSAADADILFNPNNPNDIGAAPSQFRQLIVNEIAQEYNAGRPASEQLTTDARINAYFNSNYQIIARVIPGDGWTFVVTEKANGNVLIPMVDNGSGTFLPHATMLPIDASGNYLGPDDQARLELATIAAPRGTHPVLTYDNSGSIVVGFYDSNNVLQSWVNVARIDPDQMLVSAENGAVVTPESPVELHDTSTWPEDMRTYFERDPSEWNHPTQEYMSDDEFHAELINMRRDFVADLGVEDADTMNEQELFYEYVRWGMENKQILTLSPHELRTMLADPANAAASYQEINGSTRVFYEGLNTLGNLQTNMPGSQFQEALQQFSETRLTFPVFGELITLPRMAYDGFVGNQAGNFRLPGVEPEQGVGILGHWNPSPGQHAWIPLITHFSSHQYHPGDIGLYFDRTFQITQDTAMVGAHTGPLGNEGEWLVLQRLVENIGRKIRAIPDANPPTYNIQGGFPWQMGIEGAQQFDFPNSPTSLALFPPTQYPWTP